jgi:diguanylate cyclase (GGDEF)-like protein
VNRPSKIRTVATASRQLREHVERTAYEAAHDQLTDLPNRALLLDRIERMLRDDDRTAGRGALVLLGIDRFRDVNYTLGHIYGDDLIEQMGSRLYQLAAAGDTVRAIEPGAHTVLIENAPGSADEEPTIEQAAAVRRALASCSAMVPFSPARMRELPPTAMRMERIGARTPASKPTTSLHCALWPQSVQNQANFARSR